MKLLKYTLVIAALAAVLGVRATQMEFKTLSVSDGLSQSTVLAMAQDDAGRIWMGTQDGLNCYDSYTFTVYRHDETDSTSLGDNFISSLLWDDGVLWAGTNSGLSCYDARACRFENFTIEGRPMHVADIARMEDGNLLLATDLGVAIFDRKHRTLDIKQYLSGIKAHTISPVKEGGFLVGTSNGIYRYSTAYGNLTKAVPEMNSLDVASIVTDGRSFWAATHGNGLYRLDSSLRVEKIYTTSHNHGLISDYIRVLEIAGDGRLWIGTFNGLSIYDPASDTFRSYDHTSEPGSLSHNSIRSIFIDSQQGVWLGTYYGGVNWWHPFARRFDVMRQLPPPAHNSISDNTISCITKDRHDKHLWIGTNDNGVNICNTEDRTFRYLNVENGRLLSNNIKCLTGDANGNMWIGTHAGGLSRMNLGSGAMRHYRINSQIPINNSCYSLLDRGDGTLDVGTLSGLLSLDVATGNFTRHIYADLEPRLASAQVESMLRDSNGRVWIGTSSGLYMASADGLHVADFNVAKIINTDGLGVKMEIVVLAIMEDSQHNIWVGTRNGLLRYNEQDGTFTRFTVADGLPNNNVYALLEDELARLWITTNAGLTCFDRANNRWRTYTQHDGIANNQFNPSSCYKDSDGRFYFGGIGGLTSFRPHDITDNPFAPDPMIVDVETDINDDTEQPAIDRDSAGRVLAASSPSTFNHLRIRFVAVNPLADNRNMFAYKLEGFDTRWINAATCEATYSNLAPGNYTFHVKAANNDGKWSAGEARAEIRIVPVWWQTKVAHAAFILLVILGIGAILAAIVGRMKMRMQLTLERREKQQIRELSQDRIRFYIDLSHELQTPLSLIMSPLQEIRQHGTADQYIASRLNYVYRNSLKLLHIVNQMLDYHKAEQGVFRMRIAVQDVDAIVGEVFSMFEEVAQKRDMDYILNSDLRGEHLPVDRMFIEIILTNLLSNAFKFTSRGGMIRVSLQRLEHKFRITVRDNGSGMTSDEIRGDSRENRHSTSRHGGLGLSIVRRIVEMHQGELEIRSEVGKYSEFSVTLPAEGDSYPAEKWAREDDVRGSIIRDAGEFLPDEWSGDDDTELVPAHDKQEQPREVLMMVEKDREIANYISDHFKRQYDVHCVATADEALERLKSLEPDIIIIDRMLAGMDGLKLCQMIKQNLRTCHIPIILLAPDGGVEEQIVGIEAGADGYLPMPLSVSLLRAKVQSLLKSRYRMRHRYAGDGEIDPDKVTSNTLDGEFLKKAIEIVEANISNEEFSSTDFSRALCMSRSNLHLKMKSITGESATKFIRKIRFNYACRLLMERKYSIAEISAMVGFNSPSYFATSFKKHVGCLPTEYVRQHQGEEGS